jgi:excinuclease UvrABC nuclease subunit
MKKNILEELPWFGPKTRKKILNKYWNLEKLKTIDIKELSKILNKNQIEILKNHWLIE